VILHWSKLVSSALLFFLEVLVFKPFFVLSKVQTANCSYSPFTLRFTIITLFFSCIQRVETPIKKTSYTCIETLIRLESHSRDLVQNEEKYKLILKPVLTCLSQGFDKMNKEFLGMFKSLLKLLSHVFNKSLSDKLIEHLRFLKRKR